MSKVEKATKYLEKYNQKSVIKIMEKLDANEKEELAKQILETDLEEIIELYKNRNKKSNSKKVEPIDFIDKNKLDDKQKEDLKKIGGDIIKNGQYAVVTMAGGQGTRLGFKGPKGTYKLDIGKSGKFIFEILVDTLKKAKEQYGVELNWYIMTSIENNEQTIDFFKAHHYFGYNKQKIKFFNQNVLPLLDKEANLLVDKKLNIRKASDGNGGIYGALKNTGMLADMKEKGIKWVYVCGVDNIMANMVDSIFLGLAIKNNVQTASKSVKKAYPEEKVGVFCKKNGKPGIVEYIDMDEKMIHAKDINDELLYGESNIVSHLFSIEALEKLAKLKLKYHCAEKKNSYIDENLKEVIPEMPNTYKFESFIFDGFEFLNDMLIMRVNREEEFAPIKNATGVDSPQTAKAIYERWKLNESSKNEEFA